MFVLFLDIDGVLNRRSTKERCGSFIGVDRELSNMLLNWLKTHPEIKIVLSSTWRRHPDMHEHLHEAGIFWIEETPVIGRTRGHEIAEYLLDHPNVTNYIILDDDPSIHMGNRNRWVQTYDGEGLQQKHLAKLEKLFNESHL